MQRNRMFLYIYTRRYHPCECLCVKRYSRFIRKDFLFEYIRIIQQMFYDQVFFILLFYSSFCLLGSFDAASFSLFCRQHRRYFFFRPRSIARFYSCACYTSWLKLAIEGALVEPALVSSSRDVSTVPNVSYFFFRGCVCLCVSYKYNIVRTQ